MTALLVILMVVVFFGIDAIKLYIKRHNGEAEAENPVEAFSQVHFPRGLFLGKGHSWARLTELGELKIGMDEFLTQALGGVDRVKMAAVGSQIKKGEPLATVWCNDHRMDIASPVNGTVMATNEHASEFPSEIDHDPYGRGWLASVWPTEHSEALASLQVGDRAKIWLEREVQRFADFLTVQHSPATVGATMADGAQPIVGAVLSLDEDGWTEFRKNFTEE